MPKYGKSTIWCVFFFSNNLPSIKNLDALNTPMYTKKKNALNTPIYTEKKLNCYTLKKKE